MAKKETSKKKETTKKSAPKKDVEMVNLIKVDVKNVKCPISRVDVTQEECDKANASGNIVYHNNLIVAKRMAHLELEGYKNTMDSDEFTDCYWKIETFV
jgi:hypothetical protein